MWNDQKVSVVLMTYAEKDSIRHVIENFLATGVVEVLHGRSALLDRFAHTFHLAA